MASDMPETSKRQAWFCTTALPSDAVVDVGNVTFHLHKFPLMAKSKKLNEMMAEQETNVTVKATNPRESEEDKHEEIQEEKIAKMAVDEHCHITLPDFPGGSETFETAAKLCYAVKIELSAFNIAAIVQATNTRDLNPEIIENCLLSYAKKHIPGVNRAGRRSSSSSVLPEIEVYD
ncbi:hypothetical protein LXL04_031401 [Taraxacum kok-saghyz]